MTTNLEALRNHVTNLDLLHQQFQPHPGQIAPGKALFYEGAKRMFLCMGRRSGKSTFMCYAAVRWALSRPYSMVYIVGPYLNQTREIYLHSGQLERTCPRSLIKSMSAAEGRITFTNNSFVRLLGADNPDSLRGPRASLLLFDEIKDVKEEVLDIAQPMLADEDGPMVIAGTPPEVAEHFFWKLVKQAKTDSTWRYFHLPTTSNPHIKPEVIEREKARLEARGDGDVFVREYLAEFVPGGKRAVFPMLTESHIRPQHELLAQIDATRSQWRFYAVLDPGTASTFAVTLNAVNLYTNTMYVLDEVYVTEQSTNSIGQIWPRVADRMMHIHQPDTADEQWTVIVDEAATWARNELLDQFGVSSFPTSKAANKKADGISLIRDLLVQKKMLISDLCYDTRREMLAYMLDKRGQYVKKDDHAIDTLRYCLAASNFTMAASTPPVKEIIPEDEKKQWYTIEDDMRDAMGVTHDLYMWDDSDTWE